MTIKELKEKYPSLKLINKVDAGFSTLEEYENENTYVQIIDDEIVELEHNGEMLIDKL